MTSGSESAISVPLVLVWAGNDPSGGAGLAADCAALLSHGCHPCPVVTTLTVQDSCGVQRFEPIASELVEAQARAVLDDLPVAAFKVGVVGSRANAEAIARVVADHPGVPLVLDPVLHGGQGGSLSESGLAIGLLDSLLPLATVVTPNAAEAERLLSGTRDPDEQARQLRGRGCDYVLLTGADSPGEQVVNRLYGPNDLNESYKWERVRGTFHGTGCTLASALTGLIAQGVAVADAVFEAQAFTWQAICRAHTPGRGQGMPDRMFWARADEAHNDD